MGLRIEAGSDKEFKKVEEWHKVIVGGQGSRLQVEVLHGRM
jgi:hypothetical protein